MVTTEDIRGIVETIELSAPVSNLQDDVPLVTQGFDSLDMATLLLELETKYKKAIPLEKAARLRTLKEIASFLSD
jgi:acyl carrier protein